MRQEQLEAERAHAFTLVVDSKRALTISRWRMISLVYGSGMSHDQVATSMRLPIAHVRAEVSVSMQIIAGLVCGAP